MTVAFPEWSAAPLRLERSPSWRMSTAVHNGPSFTGFVGNLLQDDEYRALIQVWIE